MTAHRTSSRHQTPTGPAFKSLFEKTLFPALNVLSRQIAVPSLAHQPYQVHEAPDAVAFSMLTIDLIAISMIVDHPLLRLWRGTFARMARTDLLTIDLTKTVGPIDCEVELAASWRAAPLWLGDLTLWVGADKGVALVPSAPQGALGKWEPSVLLTPEGLLVSVTDPFSDENSRQSGIERAIMSLHAARQSYEPLVSCAGESR